MVTKTKVAKWTLEDVKAALKVCGNDGHGLYGPEQFTNAGVNPDLVPKPRVIKSDGTPKGSVFKNGVIQESVEAIYSLELLRMIASSLDVKYADKYGRGSEAVEITTALNTYIRVEEAKAGKTEVTDVIFRKYRATGKMPNPDTFAIFPAIPGTNDPNTCMDYHHVGQHGSCNPQSQMARSMEAKEEEYASLKKELENRGYTFRVMKRMTPKHAQQRVAKLNRMRS